MRKKPLFKWSIGTGTDIDYERYCKNKIAQWETELIGIRLLRRCKEFLDLGDLLRIATIMQTRPVQPGINRMKMRFVVQTKKDPMDTMLKIHRAFNADLRLELDAWDDPPKGCYKGTGTVCGVGVDLEFTVPWLPPGCEIHKSRPRRTWSTKTTYSVSCARR